MALGAEVVDLIRLHLLDDPDQVGAVGEISVVENQSRVTFMRILVEVIDSARVETASAAFDAMHHVTLFQQQLHSGNRHPVMPVIKAILGGGEDMGLAVKMQWRGSDFSLKEVYNR